MKKKHKMHKSVKNAFFIFFLNCVLAFCGNMKIILISIQQKKKKNHCNLKFAVKNILCEKFQMLLVFKYFSI